jgi:gliding motility-associated-like protein
MNKYIISILLLLLSFTVYSQKEASNWCFGYHAGIKFINTPIPFISSIEVSEGSSAISDTSGNLLFYSDGIKVWNKNHQLMENGWGLYGHMSTTQSALIVPKPNSDSIFYIFTLDAIESYLNNTHKGFNYSIVNIKENNGLGKVIAKNIPITDSTCERIAAIKHCNGRDIWIIVSKANSNNILSYLLTDNGLLPNPVISNCGLFGNNITNGKVIGYFKASADGRILICTYWRFIPNLQILNFNSSTGIISHRMTLQNISTTWLGAFGVEFSNDNRFIYVSYDGKLSAQNDKLIQYDLSLNDSTLIGQSGITVYTGAKGTLGILQKAIDKKIYVATYKIDTLGVINSPDSLGLLCDFQPDGFYLGGFGSGYIVSLPSFPSYYFNTNKQDFNYSYHCFHYNFIAKVDTNQLDSLRWDFGDNSTGISNTSSLLNPNHLFSDTGQYTVTLYIYYHCNRIDTVSKIVNVALPLNPFSMVQIKDTVTEYCLQLQYMAEMLDTSMLDSLRWDFGDTLSLLNNTSTQLDPIHTYSVAGIYTVTLYLYGECHIDTITKTIKIEEPQLQVNLGADTILCDNNILLLTPDIQTSYNYTISWQNGDSSSNYLVTQPGKYWINLSSGGCTVSDTINVGYESIPVFSLPNDTTICEDSYVDIIIPQGNYQFYWSDGNTQYNRKLEKTGIYGLTLYNSCGSVSDEIFVKTKGCHCYLYIPNAFTPTTDGLNDCFRPIYECDFESYRLIIFNRWGQQIFESNNPEKCWDGKYEGKYTEPGVYVYLIEYKSIYESQKVLKKGIVSLIR